MGFNAPVTVAGGEHVGQSQQRKENDDGGAILSSHSRYERGSRGSVSSSSTRVISKEGSGLSCCFYYKDLFHMGMGITWHMLSCLWQNPAVLQKSRMKKTHKTHKRFEAYLVGFSGELAATELALDLALGAVMLQVVGQVAARQLDGAAIGARDYVEGAGGEVALKWI